MKGLKQKTCCAVIPNLFGTKDWFRERQFFHRSDKGDGLGMIQAHYIYRTLYFYYYYISSSSDHQALDPRGWGSLLYSNYVHICPYFENMREAIFACIFWIAFRFAVVLYRILQFLAGLVVFLIVMYVCACVCMHEHTHLHVCMHVHMHTHTLALVQLDTSVSIVASLSYSTNTFEHLSCARYGFKYWWWIESPSIYGAYNLLQKYLILDAHRFFWD